MKSNRFVKFYIEDFDQIFHDIWAHRLYSWLLKNVTHQEYEYNGMLLQRGQYVRSITKLVNDLSYKKGRGMVQPGRATINRAINKLESLGLITTEYPIESIICSTDNKMKKDIDSGTLFTVVRIQSDQRVNENELKNNGIVQGISSGIDNGNKTRINKQELNNKSNKDNDRGNQVSIIFRFYEENGFGTLSPYVAEKIGAWIDDLNEELVLFAMKLAIENNVRRWNYIETILKDWLYKGLHTLDDVEADKLHFELKNKKERGLMNGGKIHRKSIPQIIKRRSSFE